MFIGHYALAFGAKRAAPRVSLGVTFAAAQLLDLLWPIFLLLGWEQVRVAPGDTALTPLAFVRYPISHSLLMSVVWAVLAAALYYAWRRDGWGAVVVALLVVSHWVLDAIAHRPDLPLVPGGATRVGLGLWNSLPATVLVESALFLAGVGLYLSATRPRDGTGRFALVGLVLLLLAAYANNLIGPPPPSADTVAWASLTLWLLPFWGAWIDRHRDPVAGAAAS